MQTSFEVPFLTERAVFLVILDILLLFIFRFILRVSFEVYDGRREMLQHWSVLSRLRLCSVTSRYDSFDPISVYTSLLLFDIGLEDFVCP